MQRRPFHQFAMRVIRLGGISRHGLIASARWVARSPRPSTAVRLAWVVPAATLIGFGVAFLISAEIGVPPYDVLLSAIDRHTVLSHGQASWAVSATLMTAAAILGVRPRPVGVVYVVMVGFAVDLALQTVTPPDALGVRVGLAASGLLLLAGGIALIVHTQATGGAMELLMQAGAKRGFNVVRVRTALEFSLLALGLVLGGSFGVMTVIIALTLGPSIAWTLQALADYRAGRSMRLENPPAEALGRS